MRLVLSDDPALAEIRTAVVMHQTFVHSFTASCDVCGDLYATEEQLMEKGSAPRALRPRDHRSMSAPRKSEMRKCRGCDHALRFHKGGAACKVVVFHHGACPCTTFVEPAA